MPFKSEAQRAFMWANNPTMARKWEKHTPKGKKLPRKLHPEKTVGLTEDLDSVFGPMLLEGDYPWTRRAGLASAGMLLGLLATQAMNGQTTYVESPPNLPNRTIDPPAPPPMPTPRPQQGDSSPSNNSGGSGEGIPDEPFQSEALTVDEAKEFIAPNEGTRSKVYKDSRGKKTIGVGFNLNQPGADKLLRSMGINYLAVKTGKRKLTPEEIDRLFTHKVEEAMRAGPRVLGSFDDQPKAVQLAVVDMIYNLGPTGFAGFDAAIAHLNRKNYPAAANAFRRSAWYRQVGGRAETVLELIRSAEETKLASRGRGLREDIETIFGAM